MVRPVQRGQYSGRAIDLLEVRKVVSGSQVQASLSMHPAIRLCPCQDNHWLDERRAQLEHGAVLSCQVREERGNISAPNMRIEQQLPQGDDRYFPGKAGASKQGTGQVLSYRIRDGAAYQVDIGDRLDTRLHLVIELKYEPHDVARLEEADDYDFSRVGNHVVEEHSSDARGDELHGVAVLAIGAEVAPTNSTR